MMNKILWLLIGQMLFSSLLFSKQPEYSVHLLVKEKFSIHQQKNFARLYQRYYKLYPYFYIDQNKEMLAVAKSFSQDSNVDIIAVEKNKKIIGYAYLRPLLDFMKDYSKMNEILTQNPPPAPFQLSSTLYYEEMLQPSETKSEKNFKIIFSALAKFLEEQTLKRSFKSISYSACESSEKNPARPKNYFDADQWMVSDQSIGYVKHSAVFPLNWTTLQANGQVLSQDHNCYLLYKVLIQ